MPTLYDLIGGDNPEGLMPAFGQAIGQNRNSLIGLGLGLAGATRPGLGEALQGFQAGANTDVAAAYHAAQMKQHQNELALRKQQFAWQQQQAGVTEAQKAMRDVLGPDATPQAKADFMKQYYAPKTEGDWAIQDVGTDAYGQPVKRWVHKRTLETRPIDLGTGVAAAPSNAFTAGTPPVYGEGGDYSAGAAAAGGAQAAPAGAAPIIPGPGGMQYQLQPGQNLKTAREELTKEAVKAATGQMTESQATGQQYATRMEVANRSIKPLEGQGTSLWGKGLEAVPGGLGTYAQSSQYQEYKNAKSQFITALLRKESGAVINANEFERYDRELFPQPGDSPNTIEQKRASRESAIEAMKRGAGPAYRAPAETPRETPIGGGGGAPASPAGGRTGGAALPVVKWGRDAQGNPIPMR